MKRFTKYALPAAIGAFAIGSYAQAGSLEQTTADPQVISPPVLPVAPASDWTGFYTGLQLGYADMDGIDPLDGHNETYGFHAGYDYDFGDFVLGGELDYDKTDVDLGGAANVDSVARVKVKGGYDLGNTLIYATAGAARADTSVGDETGPFAGIGVSYKVTEQYTIGAELLEHRFDDVGGAAGNDLDATTLTVRGSLRF
ncbi:Outer membrane protein [Sulfitobacter noctilucicola]|uniref:Putative porin n=1 Tax=Sulfitobacter noctilucicola TaxID=1342301 RepID=A0A7W6M7T9_9RHOB|nr:outer membrane beta-barrel protein [Sulfitobacter noctilucicola]KIN64795.1 Outer membrane protein [Sulfitobacter noctilucicola]MBB4174058.1 putative porin [Sulfitobacter noctilucicola]